MKNNKGCEGCRILERGCKLTMVDYCACRECIVKTMCKTTCALFTSVPFTVNGQPFDTGKLKIEAPHE